MKKVLLYLAAVMVFSYTFAQIPQKISYQAVIRTNNNLILANTDIKMQLSILKDSVNGIPVYVETQTAKTNTNGLIAISIGSGRVVSGNFTTIDWSTGSYFLKTETDPTGGENYTITGVSQMLSVPYALYAESAKSISSFNTTHGHILFNKINQRAGWIVPNGIYLIELTIVGCNGGDGGDCTEVNNGYQNGTGDGGKGGSGYIEKILLNAKPGDFIEYTLGVNGTKGSNYTTTPDGYHLYSGTGTNGGASNIYLNSILLATILGGTGGTGGYYYNGFYKGSNGSIGSLSFDNFTDTGVFVFSHNNDYNLISPSIFIKY